MGSVGEAAYIAGLEAILAVGDREIARLQARLDELEGAEQYIATLEAERDHHQARRELLRRENNRLQADRELLREQKDTLLLALQRAYDVAINP